MKRTIAGALIAAAALVGGNAMAADLGVKAPMLTKAPPPVYNWTGCYLGGGGGYGMWNQDAYLEDNLTHVQFSAQTTNGGRGWFGTASGGCDYQFVSPILSANMVIGALADGDWGSLKGTYNDGVGDASQGDETMQSAWYVGGRIGWLVTPTLLSYFDGGYTQAHFSQIDLSTNFLPTFSEGTNIGAHNYSGWFLGGGVEYALPMFSGLFWRNEYRYSTYKAADLTEVVTATGVATGTAVHSEKFVQTARTELIFRFNWFH